MSDLEKYEKEYLDRVNNKKKELSEEEKKAEQEEISKEIENLDNADYTILESYEQDNPYLQLRLGTIPALDSIMKLFVNLQKDKFDLFLIKNQNLIAYNSFPQSNVDDFMYYLFALIEQYKLSANSFDLLFLDKIEIFESYYSTIKNFHDKIIFLEKDEALKVNNDHPSPYFLNII